MQVKQDRAAGRKPERHERAFAPEARARCRVHMQHRSPVAHEQPREARKPAQRGQELARRSAVAMRRHVFDRPALEPSERAIGVDDGRDAAARVAGRPQHDQPAQHPPTDAPK